MVTFVIEVTEAQAEYVMQLWFAKNQYRTFNKKDNGQDVLPKKVKVTEVFKHPVKGWCIAFIDHDVYVSASYFKTFESFFQEYIT